MHNKKLSVTKGTVVQAFDENGEMVMEFHSMSEADRQTGIPQQNISRCINGKCKTAGGYIWKKIVRNGGKE